MALRRPSLRRGRPIAAGASAPPIPITTAGGQPGRSPSAEAFASGAHPIAGGRWELRRADVTTDWSARRHLDGISVDTVELGEVLLVHLRGSSCDIEWR